MTAEDTSAGRDEQDRRTSARTAKLLELVPPSTEPLRPDTSWVPRRKQSFDMFDLYGDRE